MNSLKNITFSLFLISLLCDAASAQTNGASHQTVSLNTQKKEEWKRKLEPGTYTVMVEKGTEAPYQNKYWNNHEKGTYVSAATGEPLFSSDSKFESHTGWPSFSSVLGKNKVEIVEDDSFGEVRQEVVEKKTGLHLGHLFNDGPAPSGLRFCMNSAALKFVKAEKSKK